MECFGSARELIPKMRELLSLGEGFWLTVTGYSMSPSLTHLKDKVYISPFNGYAKKGEILLTQTKEGKCILHRLVKYNGDSLYYQGDALNSREGPLPSAYVIGRVTKIQHKGKIITPGPLYNRWSMLRSSVFRHIKQLFYAAKKILKIIGYPLSRYEHARYRRDKKD